MGLTVIRVAFSLDGRTWSIQEELLRRNVKRFRGGLVFEAHRCVSLNSRLESNNEEKKEPGRSGGSRRGEVRGRAPSSASRRT